MKLLLLTVFFTISSCKLIRVRTGDDNLWNEFKKYFGKNYLDEDDVLRKPKFQKALQDMMEHNMGYYRGDHSFLQGLNHFSDMSDEDFEEHKKGYDAKMKCDDKSLTYNPPKDHPIPDSIDWNERGYVTRVVNQNACGACWAFCAVAALEGQHKRRTGKLVKLSEQQLTDCSTDTGNKKCNGGQMCRAYESAIVRGGVDTEESYPYENKGGECRFSKEHIGSRVKGYLEIPYGDEQALLMAVAIIGPVAAGLDGYRPGFRHYKSGIYDDPNCSNTTLDHALTVVGYGTENGKDYWLVKNSWSTLWGDNGFGKIARNKNNMCGIASSALFPVLDETADGQPSLQGKAAT